MATEQVVEQVAEQVAENLEDAAVVVRHVNAQKIGYSLAGLGVGLVVGFVVGYRLNRAKIRAEAFKESEEEVEKIREMYRDSTRVVRDVKPDLEQVIGERQYSIPVEEQPERPTRPPVPVTEPPVSAPSLQISSEKSKHAGWNFEEELATRSDEHPYIIHQDEYQANETGYRQTVLTWWAGDNVLADEEEQPIPNADDVVDLNHMSRFGHGTDDIDVLFIRNDRLRAEYEIGRVSASYEEEVKGLSNDVEPD